MRLWRGDRQYCQKKHDSNNLLHHPFVMGQGIGCIQAYQEIRGGWLRLRFSVQEICNGEWSIGGPFIIPQPNSDRPF
jgi:hypothetical protein